MTPTFTTMYLLPGLITWYVACSIAVSVDLGKDAPFIATPRELKENVTIGELLICFLVSAIPFFNLVFAGAGLVVLFINVVAWTFCRIGDLIDYFDLDHILKMQPFRKKKNYKGE